mmetsp:Transcript_126940/g.365100  ORF Transcript_126940/g.365100 Transcript_126940/m.365100 type:complete len:316 (-) Transcript_126940:411-1358(-)
MRPKTSKIAMSSASPSIANMWKLSSALHTHLTSLMKSGSKSNSSMPLQMLSRSEGSTTMLSSNSPARTFCSASASNASCHSSTSRRRSSASSRKAGEVPRRTAKMSRAWSRRSMQRRTVGRLRPKRAAASALSVARRPKLSALACLASESSSKSARTPVVQPRSAQALSSAPSSSEPSAPAAAASAACRASCLAIHRRSSPSTQSIAHPIFRKLYSGLTVNTLKAPATENAGSSALWPANTALCTASNESQKATRATRKSSLKPTSSSGCLQMLSRSDGSSSPPSSDWPMACSLSAAGANAAAFWRIPRKTFSTS